MTMEEFVAKCLDLITLEREAEESQDQACIFSDLKNPKALESKGICVQKLQVAEQTLGIYGRQVVSFELAHGRRKQSTVLPSSLITTGSIVGVFANCKNVGEQLVSGVVLRSTSTKIQVAFDELPDDVDFHSHAGKLQLVRMNNSTTYRRMEASLEFMKSSNCPPLVQHFVEVLLGKAPLGAPDPSLTSLVQQPDQNLCSSCDVDGFLFINPNLDLSQKRAVLFALSQREVAIIHGPPGTGKTTTVVEVILQAVMSGVKVLACAPSNIAVDNMVERLAKTKAKVLRIGHPARIVDAVQNLSLDACLSRSESASIINDVRGDLEKALNNCSKTRQSAERRKWKTEIKILRKELKERERKAISQLLSGVDVVLATTSGASSEGPINYLPELHFGLVVIDECAQAIEASCWIPLLHSTKCVLAGDHMQLPPTIISLEAAGKGLSVSLMERLVLLYGDSIMCMLTTQYRMNREIMQWSSEYLYDGLLEAHESVADHLLSDLPGITKTLVTTTPLLFIDTAGCNLTELDTPDDESKGNEGEADLVLHHLKALLEAGVPLRDIAVIAPYNLQVELIRQRLSTLSMECSNLEVKSVDSFQGREKEAVVISFTRSNTEGQFGFLEEIRRSNVAITRARRHLALIGDSDTLNHEPFIKGLLAYCSDHGEVWSGHDYLNADDFEEHHYHQPDKTQHSTSRLKKTLTHKPPLAKRCQDKTVREKTLKGRSPAEENHKFEDVVNEDTTKFTSQLKNFIDDKKESVLIFPSSLSSNQRRIIHELCEQMGLTHSSKGKEPDRYVVVGKHVASQCQSSLSSDPSSVSCDSSSVPCDPSSVPCDPTSVSCDPSSVPCDPSSGSCDPISVPCDPDAVTIVVTDPTIVKCSICYKDIPRDNITLHKSHCTKLRTSKPSTTQTQSVTSKQTKSHSKSRKRTNKKAEPLTPADDLDSLLAEVKLADTMCGYETCRKKVNVIGLKCQFCSKKYCMEHNIPELHGCAEEARRHARRAHSKGHSTSQATRRDQLHKRLERKLETMSEERQPKTQSSKSKYS